MQHEDWTKLIARDPEPITSTDPAEDTWLDHTFTLESVDRPYASFMAWIRDDGRVEIRSRVEIPEPETDAECLAVKAAFGGLLARVQTGLAFPFIVSTAAAGEAPGPDAFARMWKETQRFILSDSSGDEG